MSKLEEMLKYVSEHNEFYKNRIKEYCIKDPLDINQWPILTRKELQENRYNMFSDGGKAKYYLHKLRHHSSSGSSGLPIDIYWDNVDYQRSMIYLWRLRSKYYGITPNSKKIMFSLIGLDGLNFENRYYIQPAPNVIMFNRSRLRNDDECLELVNVIESFKPDWLYIPPSILNRLIHAYNLSNRRMPSSVRYIECVGELFPSSLRKATQHIFDGKIANMYGSEENNGIALECPNGLLHVLKENVYLEVMSDNKIAQFGKGEAIVTNLNNYAMPLIRYAQGDIVNTYYNKCDCQYVSPIIDVIEGRAIEIIYDENIEISAYLLSEMINNVQNLFNNPIKNYKFVYYKGNRKLVLFIDYMDKLKHWGLMIEKYLCSKFYNITKCSSNIEFIISSYAMEDFDYKNKFKILLFSEEEYECGCKK